MDKPTKLFRPTKKYYFFYIAARLRRQVNSDEGVRALQETRRLSAAYFIFSGCTLAAENSIILAAENCVIFGGCRPRLPKITQFSAAGLRPPKIKCRQTRILTQKKIKCRQTATTLVAQAPPHAPPPPPPAPPDRPAAPPGCAASAARPPGLRCLPLRRLASSPDRRAAPPGRRRACAARAGQPASPGYRCSVGR